MQTVRFLVRALGALTAVLLAAFVPLLAGAPGAQAAGAAGAAGAAAHPGLAIAITGMSPTIAKHGSTITVSGTLANHTGTAQSGIAVQGLTSSQWFRYPEQLTQFTDGTASNSYVLPLLLAGTPYQVPATVPNGATVHWHVSFPASEFYAQFGDFPIEAQVSAAGTTYTADARTIIPYWPSGSGASAPKGLRTAWVWPLVAAPQQGACSLTLATSELSGEVRAGGRLSTLLDAGAAWTSADKLTWDIDPALLSDVSVMTRHYFTQGNAACSGRFGEPASTSAAKWLTKLSTATAGQSAFLTPYANVDVAALTHSGLETNIRSAYQIGETVAGQVLPNTFGKDGTGTGDGTVLRAAWPANGLADAETLTTLASYGNVSTVVLSSKEVSPYSPNGEDALAKTVSGVGTTMSVLSANSRITSLLGTADKAVTPASQFALTQDFLAQTAMIAAESNTERSLVIAAPTGWSPTPSVASTLLRESSKAPWLHSVTLSALSAKASKLSATTHSIPARRVNSSELSDTYMDKAATVTASVNQFKNLLYKPTTSTLNSLDAALATTESAAWRGHGSYGGWLSLSQLSGYLSDAENNVRLVVSKKILLAGTSGETAVSVTNGLDMPVNVRVVVSTPRGSKLTVGSFDSLVKVQGDGSNTVHVPVQSGALGTTTVRLKLATPNGSLLGGQFASQSLSVEVTRVGRFLLVIVGGALGILVLTSAYRLRRKRIARTRGSETNETAEAGGSG